jgi:hypothetical protein
VNKALITYYLRKTHNLTKIILENFYQHAQDSSDDKDPKELNQRLIENLVGGYYNRK